MRMRVDVNGVPAVIRRKHMKVCSEWVYYTKLGGTAEVIAFVPVRRDGGFFYYSMQKSASDRFSAMSGTRKKPQMAAYCKSVGNVNKAIWPINEKEL